jgi:murein DD-endopeptidase MepM/ murein hydrolase activator NlpD
MVAAMVAAPRMSALWTVLVASLVVLSIQFAPVSPAFAGDRSQPSDDGTRVAFLPSAGIGAVTQQRRELKVRQGDTLMKMMTKVGVPRAQAYAAISALRPVYDPRSIMPGQSVTVTFSRGSRGSPGDGRDSGVTLQSIDLSASLTRKVLIERDGSAGFTATERKAKLAERLVRVEGIIKNSLYRAGSRAGLPAAVLAGLTKIFSWDVDFQRDIQPGDKFDIAFTRYFTGDGVAVRDGQIQYAALTLSGKRRALYRFEYAPGQIGYFDDKGRSARKALLRTPVNGARLSSRYGSRRHPVLGYTRMHRGVDFAAPRGTPIYAAGNGRIDYRGRKGAYGRYIRIRHNDTYSTAYAHMKRFAPRLRTGSWVKQGQVIGYIGSSGLVTGSNLHFEVLKKGRQINPLRLRMPSRKTLKGRRMVAFKILRAETRKTVAALATSKVKLSRR